LWRDSHENIQSVQHIHVKIYAEKQMHYTGGWGRGEGIYENEEMLDNYSEYFYMER
jgi:hypothetical protein